MNKNLFFIFFFILICRYSYGQVGNLPTKGALSETILSSRQFTNSSAVDTLMIPHALSSAYTLELVAKVNSASGRGLDIEARDSTTKGYRLSLGDAVLQYTAPLNAPVNVAGSVAGEQQTIRIAVNNDTAYIFKDGTFVYAHPLVVINDIINGAESGVTSNVTDSTNLVANWNGLTATDAGGKPSDYGWAFSGTDPFTLANSGGGVRFMDNLSGLTYDGSAYTGRSMYIRWDGTGYNGGLYSYPISLEANTTYDFSMLYTYISNYNGTNTGNAGYSHGKSMLVGIGTSQRISDRYDSLVYSPSGTAKEMLKKDFQFTTQAAGTYYLTFSGAWAVFSIADLTVRKVSLPGARFVFGKNYSNGAVDMEITSATFEAGAYAPASVISKMKHTEVLTGDKVYVTTPFNTDFTVSGKSDIHLNGAFTPMVNSTVDLNSDSAWLFIDNVKPSNVISNWLNDITINGQAADTGTNVRIGIYVNGTVLIPHGKDNDAKAITFFTGENYTGDSANYEIFTLHDSLGTFDNKFKSFKLKRGYMATIGSNGLGLGFSKVYIADMHDVEVPVMPKGLYGKTSFVRAFRWEYVSKKGWAGGGDPLEMVNATWNYDWSAGGNSTINTNYTPIRQNGGWPSWSEIDNKRGSNHLLGFNEPDHADQANMTVDQAIQQWPMLLQSGFRLGSPAPSSPNSWLKQFMDKADSLNYRVDFVAVHCYWNSRVSGGHADSWYSGLLNTYNNWGNKRPIWITEWNNGANWTGEAWPSDAAEALAKQAADLPLILQVFDTTSFIERYSIYNWVEDKRAMVLADTLTPAGKEYAANHSALAYTSDPDVYKPADIYDHTWRIAAPILRYTLSNDYGRAVINWLDINGDLGARYVLEREADGETAFTKIADFAFDQDYNEGATLTFSDSMMYNTAKYRLYAVSYEGDTSWYSASLAVAKDPVAIAPVITANSLSATQVKLSWTFGSNARSFRLQRSLSETGSYQTILDYTTDTALIDQNLAPGTTYYYKIASLNSAGESGYSTPVPVTTPVLGVPDSVRNFYVASGDAKSSLTWTPIYDAKYTILRSTSPAGIYDTVVNALSTSRYDDTGLQNGTTYYYKIFAYNDAGVGSSSSSQAATPQLGQYLHLDFNAGTGAVARDSWGAYDGILNGGTVWSSGKDSSIGAVTLDPAATSYIRLADGALSGLNDYTLAAMVYFPSGISTNNARLFDFGSNTSTFMVLMPFVSGGVRFKITCAAGTDDRTMPVTIPTGKWVRLVITQQGVVFKFYIDGQLAYTDSTASVRPSQMGSTTANYLGKSQFGSDPYGNFSLDDFKLYDYAFSDSQVQGLDGNLTLPIQVLNLSGKVQEDRSVLLSWQTVTEQIIDHFILEHSMDGVNFSQLGSVVAQNKADGTRYKFKDSAPQSGVNYYRLLQINKDGTSKIDGLIHVRISPVIEDLAIYPNPLLNNTLTVKYGGADPKVTISIVDISGRVCYRKVFDKSVTGLYNLTSLYLARGIYFVRVNKSSVKLIKQ